MTFDEDRRIKNRRLEKESIKISTGSASAILGCELVGCHITVDVADNVAVLFESRLTDCTIQFKRKLTNTSLFNNDFQRCSFRGRFIGVDFGRSPRPDPFTKKPDALGGLIDCDFSDATLDMCRFFEVDISRQRFARWPQFVIPHANELTALQLARQWPGKFHLYLQLASHEYPSLTASTGTMDDFKKRYAITETELLQALDDVGGVIR